MIQDTSQKAFREEVVPTLGQRHSEVMAALVGLGEATNSELSTALGWSINRVTPRIHELRKAGRVADVEKRPCKVTGRTAYVWAATPGQQELPIEDDPLKEVEERNTRGLFPL